MRYLLAVIFSLLLGICIVKFTSPVVEFVEKRTITIEEALK